MIILAALLHQAQDAGEDDQRHHGGEIALVDAQAQGHGNGAPEEAPAAAAPQIDRQHREKDGQHVDIQLVNIGGGQADDSAVDQQNAARKEDGSKGFQAEDPGQQVQRQRGPEDGEQADNPGQSQGIADDGAVEGEEKAAKLDFPVLFHRGGHHGVQGVVGEEVVEKRVGVGGEAPNESAQQGIAEAGLIPEFSKHGKAFRENRLG